jgi:hypothetical protein
LSDRAFAKIEPEPLAYPFPRIQASAENLRNKIVALPSEIAEGAKELALAIVSLPAKRRGRPPGKRGRPPGRPRKVGRPPKIAPSVS